jgi:hypothetical protein
MSEFDVKTNPQYRRVYLDIPILTDQVLADKAAEMRISKKALVERLILEFVKNPPKVKKGKK